MAGSVRARVMVGITAFLTIACGLGTSVAIYMGLTYLIGLTLSVLYIPFWAHGFSLFIPGLVGFFMAFDCGCCNKKLAYIASAVIDCLGVLSFLGPLSHLWALDAMFLAYGKFSCFKDYLGTCVCTEDPSSVRYTNILAGSTFSSFEDCDRYPALYNSGVVLTTMWVFGFLALTAHLILIIYLACTCNDEAIREQVIGAQGSQGGIPMTSPQAAFYQGGYAPQGYAQPGYIQPGYIQPGYSQHGPPAYMQHGQQSYREHGHPGESKQGSGVQGQGGYYPPGYPPQEGPSAPPVDYPN